MMACDDGEPGSDFGHLPSLMPDIALTWIDAVRAGDWDRAWALSERDLAMRDPATRDDPDSPYHCRWVWDDRPFDGRDVLVRCYHGLGDTIQYARYLPMLAARAGSLAVEAQPRLCDLLSRMGCIDTLIPFDVAHPVKPMACDLEITELPFALRAAPSHALPAYLRATPADLPAETIGLCYSAGDWDPARCVDPALLATLCEGRSALTLVAEQTALAVLNPEGCPFDLEETARLVAGCALVITVDTMIAHLAGALGRPTWLLLKAEPDWRWTPGARDTPWYPSMRLYHQPSPGDWASVIEDVADDLAARYSAVMAESATP